MVKSFLTERHQQVIYCNHLSSYQQNSTNLAAQWFDINSKSQVLTLSLCKRIDSEPLIIKGTAIEESRTAKLLGVTYDQHVDIGINKSEGAFHALVQLKKVGVDMRRLAQFCSKLVPSDN